MLVSTRATMPRRQSVRPARQDGTSPGTPLRVQVRQRDDERLDMVAPTCRGCGSCSATSARPRHGARSVLALPERCDVDARSGSRFNVLRTVEINLSQVQLGAGVAQG